jgi:hypothetical protein
VARAGQSHNLGGHIIAAATEPASSGAPIITAPTAAIDVSTSIEKGVLREIEIAEGFVER